jgi:hypothetical protein
MLAVGESAASGTEPEIWYQVTIMYPKDRVTFRTVVVGSTLQRSCFIPRAFPINRFALPNISNFSVITGF